MKVVTPLLRHRRSRRSRPSARSGHWRGRLGCGLATGRSGEGGGPIATGAKTCPTFAGVSLPLSGESCVLAFTWPAIGGNPRRSVSIGRTETGVRSGWSWGARATVLCVIRALSPASPPH